MQVSDEMLVTLFQNVALTKQGIEEAARNWTEAFRRLEKGHQVLQRQLDDLRTEVSTLQKRVMGDRRFLRGIWVGVSLVCGSAGALLTLLADWILRGK